MKEPKNEQEPIRPQAPPVCGTVRKLSRLGDLITLQRGFDLPYHARKPGTVPIISSAGISGYHNVAAVHAPGVVTGRYGTIGQVFYTRVDFWPHNTTLFVKDFKGNHPRFISYLLKTLDYRSVNSKTGVPGVDRSDLHELEVWAPDRAEQEQIADTLGALDDKIEINRQTRKTLEELARSIFKAWFVDFLPVKAKAAGATSFLGMAGRAFTELPNELVKSGYGDIPRGWEWRPIDKIADFLNGLAMQKYPPEDGQHLPVIKIAEMRRGVTDGSDRAGAYLDKRYIVEDGDLLFSWSGTLDTCLWTGGRGALNQHLFKVASSEYPRWLYHHWLKEHLPAFRAIALGKATTMGHIQRGDLREAMCAIPPECVTLAAGAVLDPIHDMLIVTGVEDRELTRTRNLLLSAMLPDQRAGGES